MRISRALSWMAGLFLLGVLPGPSPAADEPGLIEGRIFDAATEEPLPGAHVLVTSLRDLDIKFARLTDRRGRFILDGLASGYYEVRVSYIGYEGAVLKEVEVTSGETALVSVPMTVQPISMNTVVISASRREEKILDAPAAVQVLESEAIEDRVVLTPADHLQGLRAVDVARSGLNQGTVVVRGFNNVFSGATLTLVDNRIARLPSLRYNALNLIPTINEDIEQIEVVSGPGSALYGPNTANGVLHIRTRPPFESAGTTVSVAGGNRGVVLVSGRHAGVPAETFAYKISATYQQGDDFESVDPVEQRALEDARFRGDPDTVKIAQRAFDMDRVAVEGRVDLRPSPDLDVVLNAGFSRLNAIELTGLGAMQAENWTTGFGQARVRWRDLFWQAYLNGSDAGDTYNLRTGDDVVDRSTLFVTQGQYQWDLSERQSLVTGVDVLLTRPDTDGTINGENEQDDDINEVGAYVQSETQLDEDWTFVGAARVDDHNHLEDPVFSPRAALVFGPAPGHKLRTTYNRAFSTPTANNLFLDLIVLDELPDLGALSPFLTYKVLTKGVPAEGFTFRRDSAGGLDGLYMQVPAGLGGTTEHVPADATRMWGEIQDLIPEIAAIPAPTPDEVSTLLRVVNQTTAKFERVDPAYVEDIARIKPTITNTFELGYKGLLGERWVASVDLWHRRIKDFVGPLRVETPNVFFDPVSLGTYLEGFGVSGPDLVALTSSIGSIPVGTVTPENAEDPADLFLTYRNFGDVDLTGVDLSLEWYVGRRWTAGLSYSYVSKDFFQDASGISDIALNAPRHKAGGLLQFADETRGVDTGVRVRFVDTFPVLSGTFSGEVEHYTLVDVSGGYVLPTLPGTKVSLLVQNVFDHPHREFVGAPELGRVGMIRLTQIF